MDVQFSFQHFSDEERQSVIQSIESKKKQIVRFSESIRLKVHAERFEKHHAYRIGLVLARRGKDIVAEEKGHRLKETVDGAVADLIRQLKKDKTKHDGSRFRRMVRNMKEALPFFGRESEG